MLRMFLLCLSYFHGFVLDKIVCIILYTYGILDMKTLHHLMNFPHETEKFEAFLVINN